MKDGIPPDTPKLGYVLDRIYESEFIEPVRFYPVRMRSLKSHDWQPRYELHLKVQNSERVEMLVDSGAELSLINFCSEYEFFKNIPFNLPYTFQILDTYYPNSKLILTIRDNSQV